MRISTLRLALATALVPAACGLFDDDDPDENGDDPTADDDGDDDGDDTGGDDGDDDDGGSEVGGDGMTDLNWHEDIAPIIAGHCGGCHRADGPAPFSVESYDAAAAWALPMAYAVQSHQMPPFFAENTDDCQVRFPWLGDPRLSDEQIDMIVDWADGGAPEGDPADAAPLPEMPQVDIQDPDSTVVIPSEVTIDGTEDRFVCFSIDPGLTEDTWMSQLQLVPGNERIVHHALV
ncbi:MAG TPA: hypothetical protein VFG69_19705, partial [Nannocystaceae bacterium]|nr:hypothetical protein [Nannocystaceae bacterium]